jgi:hypothetical protein
MKIYHANIKLFNFTLLTILLLTTAVCNAQKIENIRPEVAGEKINIFYDLVGIADGQSVFVKVYMSTDGGKTYGEPLKSVTGDVGMIVGPGKGKCIVWDVFKDMDELVSVNVKFKVKAEPVATQQIFQPLERQFKLNLNANLGSKENYLDSKSYGFNLKGAVYLNRLGIGVRGDYYKTFRKEINYEDSIQHINYPDTGYYWGYAGGAIIEYDLLRNDKYSLYPFVYLGRAKLIYKYNTEYKQKGEDDYDYGLFGTIGLGFDINIVKFLYLGTELEYYISDNLEVFKEFKNKDALDGFCIGFVIKFVINPD